MLDKVTGQLGVVVVAVVSIVGAIVLTALGKTVPTDLWSVAYISLGGAAGVARSTPPTSIYPVVSPANPNPPAPVAVVPGKAA